MESIQIEETDYYFDKMVLKDESNPTDYMKSFSVKDVKAQSFHQNTSRKCWDTKEKLADSMKPSVRTKDDVIDHLYRDFLPQINQHVITLPTKPIPPRDFNVHVTSVSEVQKNELSRILSCRRCGFIKHLVIEVFDTNTDVSNSWSCQNERSSSKVSNMSYCVSSEGYSPKLIRKDFILAQEQSTSNITRLTDNSSSFFRGHLSKASYSDEILITKREQSPNKIDIISRMLVARNNKSYQSSRSVKFHTDRIRMFVRRLADGRIVHNSSDELCALLLCPCCGTLLDDRIMWLVPMSEDVHQVSLTTGILSHPDAQGSRNFIDMSCRGIENISAAKCDITNKGRKQSFNFEQDAIYNWNRKKAYKNVSERRPVERRNPRLVSMNAYSPFAPDHLEKEPDAPRKDVPDRLNHHTAQKILALDADNQNNEHASVTKSLDVNAVVQNVKPASTREQRESEQLTETDTFLQTTGELAINQAVQNIDYSLVPEMINMVSSFQFSHPEKKSANQMYDPLPIQKMVNTSVQGVRYSSAPKYLECERAVRMNVIVTRPETRDIDLTVHRDNNLPLQEKYDISSALQMNAPSFSSDSQNNQATPMMGDRSLREISPSSLNFVDKRVESDGADHKKQLSFTFVVPDSKSSILMNELLHTQIEVESSASIWTNDGLCISDELKVYLGTEKDERINNHLCEVVLLANNLVKQSNDKIVTAEKLYCDSAVEKVNSSTTLEQQDFVSAKHTKNQLSPQKKSGSDLNFQTENRSPVQEQEGKPSSPRLHSANKPLIQRMDDPSKSTVIKNEFAFLRTNSSHKMNNLTKEPHTKSDYPSSAGEGLEKDMSLFRDGSTSVAAETLKSESIFQRKDTSLAPGHTGSYLAIKNNEVLSLAEQLESKEIVYKKDRPEVLLAWQNRKSIPALQQSECKQAVKRLELSPTSKMPSSVLAKWKHCPATEPISGVGDYTSVPQIPPDSAVQALLEHGYNQHKIRDAYNKIHQSFRSGCLNAADMMEAIHDMEQKEIEIEAHMLKLESDNSSETRTLHAKGGHERASVNCSKEKKGPDILPDSHGCRLCCTALTMLVFLMCGHMMTACPQCAKVLRKCPECKKTIKRIVEPKF